MKQRAVSECPYREVSEADDQLAVCRLLAELTRLEDTSRCIVRRDACAACCQWFSPSANHLNPVIASLLYQLTATVMRQGGAAGCEKEAAASLNLLAERALPTEEEVTDPSLCDLHRSGCQTDSPSSLETMIPLPERRGRGVREWAVGITTAPREVATLEICYQALARAGWDQAHLFVDGPLELPDSVRHLPATVRKPAVGVWANYYLTLQELALRNPTADALLILQDDALMMDHSGVRRHVESALWQERSAALASLFCPANYNQSRPGWHRAKDQWSLGPVAFVFSREAANQFLADPTIQNFERESRARGHRGIDGLIGRWAFRSAIPIYFTTPSLVQHIGHTSTLWKHAPAFGPRRASDFRMG